MSRYWVATTALLGLSSAQFQTFLTVSNIHEAVLLPFMACKHVVSVESKA